MPSASAAPPPPPPVAPALPRPPQPHSPPPHPFVSAPLLPIPWAEKRGREEESSTDGRHLAAEAAGTAPPMPPSGKRIPCGRAARGNRGGNCGLCAWGARGWRKGVDARSGPSSVRRGAAVVSTHTESMCSHQRDRWDSARRRCRARRYTHVHAAHRCMVTPAQRLGSARMTLQTVKGLVASETAWRRRGTQRAAPQRPHRRLPAGPRCTPETGGEPKTGARAGARPCIR